VEPLDVLFEAPGLPAGDLPDELTALYGGTLGFTRPRLVSNFVSSIDGVVALEPLAESSYVISGGSDADRFVMGLLRASADAVLIGAGTMRHDPEARWTPEDIAPGHANAFRELRRRAGIEDAPELVVVSASGNLEPGHPGLEAGAAILTTEDGRAHLRDRVPSSVEILALGPGPALSAGAIVKALQDRGHTMTLVEGGPSLLGVLVEARALQELFLTLSPVLAGRNGEGRRPSLVTGHQLQPPDLGPGRLLSVRRDRSHLFLRYELWTEPVAG
jgi:riboflavin biosynthesis pyrimidine reductase